MDALKQAQGLPMEQGPVRMETAGAAAAQALPVPEDKGKLLCHAVPFSVITPSDEAIQR